MAAKAWRPVVAWKITAARWAIASDVRCWHKPADHRRAESRVRSAQVVQTSTCSANVPARHQPQCPSTARCFRSWCGQAGAAWHAGCLCGGGSTLPLSLAGNVSRTGASSPRCCRSTRLPIKRTVLLSCCIPADSRGEEVTGLVRRGSQIGISSRFETPPRFLVYGFRRRPGFPQAFVGFAQPRSGPDHPMLGRGCALEALENLSAEIRRGRSDQRSSPWSTPPRSLSQTSPSSPRTHRLPPAPAAASVNRRSSRHGCRST